MSEFQKIWKENYSSLDFQKNVFEEKGINNGGVRETSADNTSYRNKLKKILKDTFELIEQSKKAIKFYQDSYGEGGYGSYQNGNYGGGDEAEKSFNSIDFSFMIEKAYPVDENGNRIKVEYSNFTKEANEGDINLDKMYIEGIASTTNVDHDQERMSQDAMNEMVNQINVDGVPLMSEHMKTWDAKLGDIFKAWMDERNQLHIKAKLDKDSSKAVDLYKALRKGLQVGLSVAGIVKRSAQEFVENLGKKIKTFYNVALKEISVTNRPSNFDTWIIAKGQKGSLEEHFFGKPHRFYEEYLQNYPSLNWQFQIAKSVAEVSKDIMPEENKKEEIKAVEEKAVKPKEDTTTDETKTDKKEEKKAMDTTTSTTEDTSTKCNKSQDEMHKEMLDAFGKMGLSFDSLAKEIQNLLKQGIGKENQDSETSVAGQRTTSTTTDKKKEIKEKAVEEKKVETTTTDTTTKSQEKEDFVTKGDLATIMAREIEKKLAENGQRLIGPVKEVIEKMMSTPNKRKGIASENAYMVEKKFAGNPDGNNEGAENKGEEEIQKDMKDEKIGFQDFFKKHFSTFKLENEK
jgi:HK97 family phage prohead protease